MRTLSATVATAVAAEVVLRTVAVELSFPSGYVRANGSPNDMVIGGNVFTGIGGLGAISEIEESSELRAYDLTVQLSGIPRDAVSLAMIGGYQGRPGTVWEVPMDRNTYAPLADPAVIFRGRMDQLNITLGQTATVQVRLLNRLADWERPKLQRYTDADQQRLHPGDTSLRFVPAAAGKKLVWPLYSWWDHHK